MLALPCSPHTTMGRIITHARREANRLAKARSWDKARSTPEGHQKLLEFDREATKGMPSPWPDKQRQKHLCKVVKPALAPATVKPVKPRAPPAVVQGSASQSASLTWKHHELRGLAAKRVK